MLIDSHTHLNDSRFNKDREKIIRSLDDHGIDLALNIGIDLKTSLESVKLAEKYDNIYATVGVHPHEVKHLNYRNIEDLKMLAKESEKVLAIGEIGLDYYYENSPKDDQKKWFEEQLNLAKELNLPVVIHSRDASEDTYKILKEAQDGNLRGVMHCYSGSVEMAKKYIDLGFYISLAGPLTFKNAVKPKEVARMIPIDYLMVETDSPYLTPEPYRGRRNDSRNVRYVAEELARIKDISIEEVGRVTSNNFKKLFEIEG